MAVPIGTKCGTRRRIRLGMGNNSPHNIPGGILGDFRGSQIQKSGEAVKRLDRLAPILVHVCGFIWEWTVKDKFAPRYPHGSIGGGGGLGGQQLKRLGNVVKRLDRLGILCTYLYNADESGNGHMLNKLAP